jgi:tetratricopeptide (TPR) repeat protein
MGMKRTAGLVLTWVAVMALTLALAGLAAAQSQTPAPAAKPQASATQAAGRAPVQAKTQEEYQAYQAAVANAQNPAAMEKSADDFAAKFPASDLRVLLYRSAMQSYQTSGDSPKMLNMGLKVLAIDKDDPEALIGVAEVLEEQTSNSDLDKDQRMNQAVTYSQHALETIDTDLSVPAGSAPQKVEAYKKYLRATAFAIVGTIQYKREQYADAEKNLRKAIDADPDNPDPVVILRLALALDQQTKYPEALQQANRAVALTQDSTDAGKMARSERDRLVLMIAGSDTPTAPASPSAGAKAPAPPPPSAGSQAPEPRSR